MRRLFGRFGKEKKEKSATKNEIAGQKLSSALATNVSSPQYQISERKPPRTGFDPEVGGISRMGNGYDAAAEERMAQMVAHHLGDESGGPDSIIKASARLLAEYMPPDPSRPEFEEWRHEELGLPRRTLPVPAMTPERQQELEKIYAEEAYRVPENAPPMTRADILAMVVDGTDLYGSKRRRVEIPIEDLPSIPWPFGNQCTYEGDSICGPCSRLPLHRMMICRNIKSRAAIFRLGEVKKTATTPGCPLCRLILASFRGSSSPIANINKPMFGEDTVIRVWESEWVSLTGGVLKNNEIAAQELGRSRRYYTEMMSGVLCELRKDATECKSMSLPEELWSYGFQLMEVAHPEDQREFRWFGNGRLIPEVVDVMRLRTWAARCLSEHGTRCGAPELSPFHTGFRVIDVENRCIVDAPSPIYQYVALSYRWPEAPHLLNLAGTRARLSQPGGLDDSHTDIPQVIKDAMTLCQRMNLPYLWVDALCIYQDDGADKDIQIGKMDQVYSRAIITIVAASGAEGNVGLPGVHPGTRTFMPTTEIIEGIHLAPFAEPFGPSILTSEWDTRGWTLQERLLSKRMLVITNTQMFWKCSHGTWYEDACLETSQPHSIRTENGKEFFDNESKSALDRYRSLATEFVFRTFTQQKDGLDGITGIANKLAPSLDSKFHCGIPETYLDACILWEWPGIYNRIWLPRMEHFPSWSWVSLSIEDTTRKIKDDLAPVLWGAVWNESDYTDSHIRMRMGKYPRIVSLVEYYKYNREGDVTKIDSQVYQGNLDPQYQRYLDAQHLPVVNIPMLPIRMYATAQEYVQLATVLKTNPQAHCLFPRGFAALLPRLLGFFARTAHLYIEPAHTPVLPTPDPQKFNVAIDEDMTDIIGSVMLDNLYRATQPSKMEFALVARHASNGPHSTLPKSFGWYFHCLLLEKAFEEEGREILGPYSNMVYRKVAVMFDVHCEDWERAGPSFDMIMLM